MNLPVLVLAGAFTGALWIPTAVFCVECAFGLLPPRRQRPSGVRPSVVVVVPAHDEEAGIAATLGTIRPELGPEDRVLVVADNCTDRTAEIARAAGAEVVERRDPTRRGKGYALSFALDALSASPPEVVVVVDADCRVRPGALSQIAALARETNRPVQADYVLSAPPGAGTKTRISAFAVLVRNRVRPRGLSRLGLPCQLTGSGMAFPWDVITQATPPGGNIVEDLALGLDLAERGYPPLFCPEARIESFLPLGEAATATQRTRWETGQLSTLRSTAPRLLLRGLRTMRGDLVALALDLAVPPLSMLVALVASAGGASVLAVGLGAGPLPLVSAATQAGALVGAVAAAWASFGREALPLGHVVGIPRYLLWKMQLFVSFSREGQRPHWIRTERDAG